MPLLSDVSSNSLASVAATQFGGLTVLHTLCVRPPAYAMMAHRLACPRRHLGQNQLSVLAPTLFQGLSALRELCVLPPA